jgi:biopolymer transport protein TolR
MSFSMGGDNRSLMSEINVTPLVDVMLVLLIIFMVTAPMMTQGLDVDLPQVNTQPIATETDRVVVTITAAGELFIDNTKVDAAQDVGPKVKRVMEVKNTKQVFLRADKSIEYGQVARIMGQIRQAGITAMGLVTEPEPVSGPQAEPEKTPSKTPTKTPAKPGGTKKTTG